MAAGRRPIGRISLSHKQTKDKRRAFAIWPGKGKGCGVSPDKDREKPGAEIVGLVTADGETLSLAEWWCNLYLDDAPAQPREEPTGDTGGWDSGSEGGGDIPF